MGKAITDDMTLEEITELKKQISDWECKQAELAKLNLAWAPEAGEKYYFIDGTGLIQFDFWKKGSIGKARFDVGNIFVNEADAFLEKKRREVLHSIHSWIDKNDSKRGGRFIHGGDNWTIAFNTWTNKVFSVWARFLSAPMPYISSDDKCEQLISDIGEDSLKLLFTRYGIERDER